MPAADINIPRQAAKAQGQFIADRDYDPQYHKEHPHRDKGASETHA